ncbi:uncharacterized protein LOC106672157 isoform X2 [Cimex lectularius]|uniref:Uncharacterized protein n=1 Tax=Cimex lectularius TaxID=79782 RepID=A0A8I6S913_CIMLE|nr:uncharacterized protein LOC106672157 isoform X2 [Cimex lectularius]
MERSLPSLLFVGQQIKEWIGILTKEAAGSKVMADVDMKLPDYNMAVYCLSAALAFTATIVFVMAWKRSDASKRNDEDCRKPNDDDMEGSDITNDLAWFRDRNVGGGESVPWILQEGPPGDDPIPPNEHDEELPWILRDASSEDMEDDTSV